MLIKLRLQNYRCFEDHTLEFRPRTVIVGRNNAGKSTSIEALRLVSVVVNKFPNLKIVAGPWWLNGPDCFRGVSPSIQNIDYDFDTVCHLNHYDDLPKITATFEGGETVTVYVSRTEKVIHAVVRDSDGSVIHHKGRSAGISLPRIGIMPQISHLAKEERILTREHVRRGLSSALASAHFRNELNLYYDAFPAFKDLVENTWPAFGIQGLSGQGGFSNTPLELNVRDGAFPAEVGCMGHGLQMWLQMMWFLARASSDPTIILDEPDVYLHAELQRRLMRLLRNRCQQVIVATHSVEIISEVSPDEILSVNRESKSSRFLTSSPAVQKVIRHIGGVPSPELVRLYNSRRCLFVEGNDVTYLKHFQEKLFPDSPRPMDTMAKASIGGWSGWAAIKDFNMVTKSLTGERVGTYCILDSDYHTPEEMAKRYDEAVTCGIHLHIWSRKEIENYLIVPEAIARLIKTRNPNESIELIEGEIRAKIEDICVDLKENVIDGVSQGLYEARGRDGRGPNKCNPLAREHVNDRYKTLLGRLSAIPGKEALEMMSQWSKKRFGVRIDPMSVARELRHNELNSEVVAVIRAIEHLERFPGKVISQNS